MKLEHLYREPDYRQHGRPILFIHGAWHAAWCWDQGFLDYFAERGFSAHALSLRGHGKSDGHAGIRTHRLADYVKDVEQIVAELDKEPVLVGHSMGGGILQKYLEQNAAVGAVLLAPMPSQGVIRTLLRTHWRHPLTAARMHMTLKLLPLVDTPAAARELFFSPDIPEERLNRYQALLQNESYFAFLDMLALDLPHPGKVNCPLLILGAENDAVFLPDEIRATAADYGVEAEFIPGMAHDMMLEDGWEAVADRMISWITQEMMPR